MRERGWPLSWKNGSRNGRSEFGFEFEIENLIELWELKVNSHGLRNFVNFFFVNGNEILEKGLRVGDRYYSQEFDIFTGREWNTKELEKEFFRVESTMSDYAIKISTVLQMIEN